ncbi:MAG: metal-sulfur cluster assembly factor [Mobiluncus porci]|uniref:Metal-sulfur cluster assembly factor n=1 Tax=Mobiluncus porci TaxID=2652278 RepID=A0A7K0JZT3_9ACTO|nr:MULTISPECIES: metal-sulfur cluster assembly factor [Mobiluncus]MCI6585276.1 metal-sulfur cluster assembly factor [Mobiluncus sp.]MDD7541513.1 metal-sulfur cluster assembly factor [Mobiluncus porci]MDY5748498.1 metal-sulfur cluster assembly factor [Mobiluncus porci]MST48742.1 metal-sulfur cluster assembly factor [Mobiluncus porci]
MSEETLSEYLLDSLDNPRGTTVMEPREMSAASQESASGAGEVTETPLDPEQQARVDQIVEALKDVIDPELGINIVDLGLLYGLHLDEDDLVIDMTLTSAGCPLTDLIEQQCRFVLSDLVGTTSINWVWLPPWGPDKITDDGREQLRALGFNV